jgi:hypothetical protein
MSCTFLFLVAICTVPFTAAVTGSGEQNPLGVVLFALDLFLTNLALRRLGGTVRREDLLHQQPDRIERLAQRARAVTLLTRFRCAYRSGLGQPEPSRAVLPVELPGPALRSRHPAAPTEKPSASGS